MDRGEMIRRYLKIIGYEIASRLGRIIAGIISLAVAIVVLYLINSNAYSDRTVLILVLIGVLPILFVLFGDRLLSSISDGDSFSISYRGVSINYTNSADEPDSSSTIPDTRTNYDLFLTILRGENEQVVNNLKNNMPVEENNPMGYVIDVLFDGMTDPIRATFDILDRNIALKNHIDATSEEYIEISEYADETFFAEVEGNLGVLSDGVVFEVYYPNTTTVRGQSKNFHKSVAKAEIIEIYDSGICEFSIISWNPDTPRHIRDNLPDHNPKVKISTEGVREIEWDGIEDAHNYLREAQFRE